MRRLPGKEEKMTSPQRRAVIVGGGMMGADIAAIFACGGHAVDVVQRPGKTRDSLAARIAKAIAQLDGAAADVVPRDALSDVSWADAGIVVECVNEDIALKQRLFAELEDLAPPNAALASNSSGFPISRIGEGLKTVRRMLGLHFFMPAHLVPLVEVVKSEATDEDVAQSVFALMARLGRKPVMVKKDIPGFLANRIQHALMREAWSLIERGIGSPEDIDTAVRYGFGFRYIAAGPILQKELSGLDVNLAASRVVYPDLCNDAVPIPTLAKKVAAGETGMKSGRGFYDWPPERIAAEKARYEAALKRGLAVLRADDENP
jgi:3-hydroxybutyryl-CoA dehydrogenase